MTRPRQDAEVLAAALHAAGIDALIEPLLCIDFIDGPPVDLGGIQAVLATSANGVRALAHRTTERNVALLAVGDATARTARQAGFAHVESASGDVSALADLVLRRLMPTAGGLLHVAATDVAGDLESELVKHGYRYRRDVLYTARVATILPTSVQDALARRTLDGVAVFSPRTARTLVTLFKAHDAAANARHLVCFCLSAAVEGAVAELPWRAVVTADRPTQAALIAAIQTAGRG